MTHLSGNNGRPGRHLLSVALLALTAWTARGAGAPAVDEWVGNLQEAGRQENVTAFLFASRTLVELALRDFRGETRAALETRAYPILLAGLRSSKRDIRYAAAGVLGAIGPTAHDPIPALVQAWREDAIGASYAGALVRIGPRDSVMPILAAVLTDPKRRGRAAIELPCYGPELRRIYPRLRQALAECTDSVDRNNLARAVGRVGADAADAVPVLQAMLPTQARGSLTTSGCVEALGRIGPAAAPAANALLAATVVPNQFGVEEMAAALRAIGPSARHTAPQIIQALSLDHVRRNGRLTAALIDLLREWDAMSPEAISLSIFTLRHDQEIARDAAAEALTGRGRDDPRVPAALAEALGNERQITRRAAWALTRRGPDGFPAVRDALRGGNDALRVAAAEALADAGAPAVPVLAACMKEGPIMSRAAAAYALGQMDGAAEPAIPSLREALRTESRLLRTSAARALGAIGKPARPAVADLMAVVRGAVRTTRDEVHPARLATLPFSFDDDEAAALVALARIAPDQAETRDCLIRALDSRDNSVAAAAARGLGLLGPAALPAADAVCARVDATFSDLVDAAIEALGLIGPRTAARAVPALTRRLETDVERLPIAARTLAVYKEAALPALPVMARQFDEWWRPGHAPHHQTAPAILEAFGAMGAEGAATTVPLLLRWLGAEFPALHGADAAARLAAARALGALGPAAADAFPFLRRAMETDGDPAVREAAREAMARVTP